MRRLEKIIEHKTKGAILRAKCRWHNEGEKNTKYYLNLEKRHYKTGVISQLKINDNEFATSEKFWLNVNISIKIFIALNNGIQGAFFPGAAHNVC